MAGCEEELPQPGSVPNESQGAADGYITTLPDQGTTANGRYQIINLQNHRSFVVHVPFNADKRHRLLSLIHISEPTRQCCTSRMPSSA